MFHTHSDTPPRPLEDPGLLPDRCAHETYKENVPDIRESPAVGIVEELKEFGVEVYGLDPFLDRKEI